MDPQGFFAWQALQRRRFFWLVFYEHDRPLGLQG
jgi:hypothetical protein